jgi:hypothetical protein
MKRALQELFRVGAPGVDLSKEDMSEIILAIYKRKMKPNVAGLREPVSDELKKTLDSWIDARDNVSVDAGQWAKGEDIDVGKVSAEVEQRISDRINRLMTEKPEEMLSRLIEETNLLRAKITDLRERGITPTSRTEELMGKLDEAKLNWDRKIKTVQDTLKCFTTGVLV